MNEIEKEFNQLGEYLLQKGRNIEFGKMMSAPAIVYEKKVFIFYHHEKIVFKLGKNFPIERLGVNDYTHLQPFKNKKAMMAWYEIGIKYRKCFKKLAEKSYEHIIETLGIK